MTELSPGRSATRHRGSRHELPVLEAFRAHQRFDLDDFQIEACTSIERGNQRSRRSPNRRGEDDRRGVRHLHGDARFARQGFLHRADEGPEQPVQELVAEYVRRDEKLGSSPAIPTSTRPHALSS